MKQNIESFFQKTIIPRSKVGGFTLVELLVVVAIIGIIVGIVMGNITTAKQKANDARRVSDIKSIQNALGLYQTGKGQYPIYDGYITGADILSQNLVSELVLKTMPMDPVNKDIGTLTYKYHYESIDDGSDYVLSFCLETNTISGHSKGCDNELTP